MGGLFSHYQQTAQKQYSSNPANFALGQDKPYEDLSPIEKATTLLHGFAKKTADVAVGMGKAALETGVAIGDVAERASPVEFGKNIDAGIKNVFTGDKNLSIGERFSQGRTERQARPLMFEKLTGEQLQNPDGSVNWDFARKFVGRAMEAPTYAYAGGVVAAEKLAEQGLLSRIVSRSVANLPFAGVNTAIQAGEQGNTENIGQNFLINALLLSGVSNIAGEIKFPTEVLNKTVSNIEEQIGKITPEQKLYVRDALKQGVKSDEILTNLKKVSENKVTPQEVADIVNAKIPEKPSVETITSKLDSAPAVEAKKVVQTVDPKTGEKYYFTIKQGELDKFESVLDSNGTGKGAKAGDASSGDSYHITARTPQEMEARGFKSAGVANFDEINKQITGKLPSTGPVLSQPKEIIASTESPKVETTTMKVPQENLPVGTGKEKVSRLEARVTDNLKSMTPEQRDAIGLSTYKEMNKKENIAAAVDYVTKNPADVIKILSHEMEPPKGILRNSIYVAADNLAHEDAALARKLASLSSTRAGQELSILTEINPDSPVSAMREISQARIQAVEKRLKSRSVEKTRSQVVKTIKENITKSLPKKDDWVSFVDSIKCNS